MGAEEWRRQRKREREREMCQVTTAAFVAFAIFLMFNVRLKPRGDYSLGSGEMFDSIASRYDRINGLMSLGMDTGWRRAMVDGLQLRARDRVVDLATGTADVAIMIAKDLEKLAGSETCNDGAEGRTPVVGIDPSPKMLEVGRGKASAQGLSSFIELRIGDAQQLKEIPDGSVDKVTMAFGIRNVPDRSLALSEIRRIMATGTGDGAATGEGGPSCPAGGSWRRGESVVAILELQEPRSGLLAPLARGFIKYLGPGLGKIISGNNAEYAHLTDSILAFPNPEAWKSQMEEAGLEVFSHQSMGFDAVHLYLARPFFVAKVEDCIGNGLGRNGAGGGGGGEEVHGKEEEEGDGDGQGRMPR